MIREIKFRGLNSNKCWVYGDLCTKDIHHDYSILTNGVIRTGVKKETIGQLTGIQDKNGILIYEGDIIKIPILIVDEEKLDDIHRGGEYKFINELVIYNFNFLGELDNSVEIIGNIYENPELLNQKYIKP